MSKVHTREQDFDYRMKEIMKDLLKENKKKLSDFADAEDFFNWMWETENKARLGELIIEDMVNFQTEADWGEAINAT